MLSTFTSSFKSQNEPPFSQRANLRATAAARIRLPHQTRITLFTSHPLTPTASSCSQRLGTDIKTGSEIQLPIEQLELRPASVLLSLVCHTSGTNLGCIFKHRKAYSSATNGERAEVSYGNIGHRRLILFSILVVNFGWLCDIDSLSSNGLL